ncbi:MAG: translocation/assembly module TamB domain-containing protein [Bacteroidales bacterium]|nr:translocation/assembly module TamB domain-containing protein [Bacteroidales bacterium]
MAIIIALLLLLEILILLPPVQRRLKSETESALETQLHAKVNIGGFRLGFPKKLKVQNILIEDEKSDTLASLGEFSVNVRILPLIRKKVVIQNVGLKKGKGEIDALLNRIPADTTSTPSNPQTETEPDTNPWTISVESVSVENCFFSYRDEAITGFNLVLDIGSTYLHFGTLDFEKLIEFKSAEISNTYVSYQPLDVFIEEDPNDTTYTELFDLQIHEVKLQNAEFNFIDSVGSMIFKAGGEKIAVSDFLLDINNASINFNEGNIAGATCSVEFLPGEKPAEDTGSTDYLNWGQYLWRVKGNSMDLENFDMLVNDKNAANTPGHFNNSHLNFTGLTGNLSGIILDTDTLKVKIENLLGREENGLEITNLNGELIHQDSSFNINELELNTTDGQLNLNLKTSASPTNLQDLSNHFYDISLDLFFNNLSIVNYFYPMDSMGNLSADEILKTKIDLSTQFTGYDDNADIREIRLRMNDSSSFNLKGYANNFMDSESIDAVLQMSFNAPYLNYVYRLIQPGLLDSLAGLPQWISINGSYRLLGKINRFNGKLQTDLGQIDDIRLEANLGSETAYNASFYASLYNLESLTGSDLNKVNAKFAGAWKGEELYDAESKINLFVDTLVYRNVGYDNISFNANLNEGNYTTLLYSNDTSLSVNIELDGQITPSRLTASGSLDVNNLNLYQFMTLPSKLKVKSNTLLDIDYTDNKNFAFSTDIHALDLMLPDTAYQMHEVKLALKTNPELTDFKLESYFYNLVFNCDEDFPEFIEAVVNLPGYYLGNVNSDTIPFDFPAFTLEGELDYPEGFANLFFPDLPAFSQLILDGNYNKNSRQLTFNIAVPNLTYNELGTDSLRFSLNGDDQKLNYQFYSHILYDDLITGTLDLAGAFRNSRLTNRLQYFDAYHDPYMDLSFRLDTVNENIELQFIRDSLIFSYDPWEISNENLVTINPGYLTFNAFKLSSNQQLIAISNTEDNYPNEVRLQLVDFGMGSIERLLDLDTLVYGVAQADFHFMNLFGEPEITGTLQIDNMNMFDFDFGEFRLAPFSYSKDHLYFDLSLNGRDEEILISGGETFLGDQNNLNIHAEIKRVNLEQLNFLLRDYVKDADGTLQANWDISGSIESPVLNGYLKLHDAKAGIIALNNTFTFGDDQLQIKNNNLIFDGFQIRNAQNQLAEMNGNITLANNGNIYNNFRLHTDDMEIMNSTKKENDILYGLLKARTDVTVVGPPDKIEVNANVVISRSSDITYTMPDELALNDHRGVVTYAKFDPETIDDEDEQKTSGFFTMEGLKNFKSKIEIESGAKVNIYFDNGGSDYMKARLNGFVNYNLLENNPEVSGMFQIDEGTLNYAVPMVTVEEYIIEPGSFITLSNDVYNPYLKIVASSTIRASTEGLMSADPKVMDFKVLMYLEGELNDLQLRFDISTETSDAIVSARLAQLTEEERNINALNLLVRGSFVLSLQGDELGGTSTANAQIDKFYATHLNHLIGENISFVDLKFDVQSFNDYDEQGDAVLRRNYYYNIGKSFFDDRARINYKGNLGTISGVDNEQVNSQFVQNQLEIEIKINEEGTIKGIFFRKNSYEGLLEGEVIETGGGIKISKDYNSFGDMFRKEKDSKKGNE